MMPWSEKCRYLKHIFNKHFKNFLLYILFKSHIIQKVKCTRAVTVLNSLRHFCFLMDTVLQDAGKLSGLLV